MKNTEATKGNMMWDKATFEANGGHSPECEQFCDASCPIGRQRMADANRRAIIAQARWHDAEIRDLVERNTVVR